jgi:hypothetical protein
MSGHVWQRKGDREEKEDQPGVSFSPSGKCTQATDLPQQTTGTKRDLAPYGKKASGAWEEEEVERPKGEEIEETKRVLF